MPTSSDADGATRRDFDFDPAPLERWMRDNVAEFQGPVTVSKFAGGQSNPTYRVAAASGNYVLRRKPPGKLLPGAHAVEREYRIMTALGKLDFPVPRTHGLCEDEAVVGTSFYVMDLVDGRIVWDPTFPDVPRDERMAYYAAMCDVIARLHSIDYEAAGLGDYGKPGNFFARQISRWSRQYQQDEQAGRIDAMDRLCEWLPENIPAGDETSIYHGDYRCDNMIFHPMEPRVVAVLDWELSTLGHPLADFTYHLSNYRLPQGLPAGMAGKDFAALGLPTEDEYVAMYCERTGRDGIANMNFYSAFNLWRLAAIIHGIKGRLLRGNASSSKADQAVSFLDALATLAWQQVDPTYG